MATRYFPKEDIQALAGMIVPSGYELREMKRTWEPEDEDGLKHYSVELVFQFEEKFYAVYLGHSYRTKPKGVLEGWDGDVGVYEVYLDEATNKWRAIENAN